MALIKGTPTAATSIRKYTPGEVIGGKYRLVRLLGEGGTSWVWVAENMDLEVQVAMKLIRTDLEDETIGERLLGEARSIARLGHPAIVQVFDFGKTEQNDRFIVMELLNGISLAQRLSQQGRIPALELVQLLLPIIDALDAAHNEGIVHRDLKPDNLMIAEVEKGVHPKLLDFGIAKFNKSDGIKDPKLTQVGVVVGTPGYMSPEQARGDQDLDARSDIFALMTVFYECLTGSLPFQGDVYNAVMWSIIQDDPAPFHEHGVDEPQLWELVHKGLAKDRELRWQSARELGEVLAAWLEERGVQEDLSGRSLRSTWTPNRQSLTELSARFTLPPQPIRDDFDELQERLSLRPFSPVTLAWLRASPKRKKIIASSGAFLVGVTIAVLASSPSPEADSELEPSELPAASTKKSAGAPPPALESTPTSETPPTVGEAKEPEPPTPKQTATRVEDLPPAPPLQAGAARAGRAQAPAVHWPSVESEPEPQEAPAANTTAPPSLQAPDPETAPTAPKKTKRSEQFDFGF